MKQKKMFLMLSKKSTLTQYECVLRWLLGAIVVFDYFLISILFILNV